MAGRILVVDDDGLARQISVENLVFDTSGSGDQVTLDLSANQRPGLTRINPKLLSRAGLGRLGLGGGRLREDPPHRGAGVPPGGA